MGAACVVCFEFIVMCPRHLVSFQMYLSLLYLSCIYVLLVYRRLVICCNLFVE